MANDNREGKELENFFDNLDSLPDDPDKIVEFLDGEGAGAAKSEEAPKPEPKEQSPEAEQEQPKGEAAKGDDEAESAKKKQADGQPDSEAQPRPDGVLLKDGKTVIPYEALAAARRREAEERKARELAEQHLRQAREEAARLASEIEALKAGTKPDKDDVAEQGDEIRERIKALKEQVPEIGEVMDAMLARLSEKENELAEVRRALLEQKAAERQEKVQEAIDRNPVLRYWQNENVEMFNRAAALDKQLRESDDPAMQALSLDQRFALVVSLMENLYGKAELPEKYMPKEPAKAKPSGVGAAKDEKGIPEAKGKERPLTLSDLPGGVAPATRRSFDEMSPHDIEMAVQSMLDRGMHAQDILYVLDSQKE